MDLATKNLRKRICDVGHRRSAAQAAGAGRSADRARWIGPSRAGNGSQ
jgi:hypothetical protein